MERLREGLKVYKDKEGREYVLEPFISEEEIQKRVEEMGREITIDYQGKKLTLVAVEKGGIVFLADLMRAIDLDGLQTEFVRIGSYGNGTDPGEVKVRTDFDEKALNGREVIIVEDIADTGHSLKTLIERAKQKLDLSSKPLKIAVFLTKPSKREVEVQLDYVGMSIKNEFVVGYGLDYQELHRNLPDIRVVKFL